MKRHTLKRSRWLGMLAGLIGLITTSCDHPLPDQPALHDDVQFGANVLCRIDPLNPNWMLTMSMYDSTPSRAVTYIYEGVIDVQGIRTTTTGGIPYTNAFPLFITSTTPTLTVALGLPSGTTYKAVVPMSKPVLDYTFSTASQTSGMQITMPRAIEGGDQLISNVYQAIPSGWLIAYRDTLKTVGETTQTIPAEVVRSYMRNGTLRVSTVLVTNHRADGFPGGASITYQHREKLESVEVVP